MNPFHASIAFANSPLDRVSALRGDAAWIARQLVHPDAMLVPFRDGCPLLGAGAEEGPVWLRPPAAAPAAAAAADPAAPPAEAAAIFLGLDSKNRPRFVQEAAAGSALNAIVLPLLATGAHFADLREQAFAGNLTSGEMAILGHAAALLAWRRKARRCGSCGAPTRAKDGGNRMVCAPCGMDVYPRTDPVAIMLPIHQDCAFVGRQAGWPAGRFSAPAGFIEPGETIEEAVARELAEEAKISIDAVRYVASQPWPFPGSLMIGALARATSRDFDVSEDELEEGRWVSRDDLARALNNDPSAPIKAPPPAALAHTLLRTFVDDPQWLNWSD